MATKLGKYPPQPECKACEGTGRYRKGHKLEGNGCACTYFSTDNQWIIGEIAAFGKRELKKMGGGDGKA